MEQDIFAYAVPRSYSGQILAGNDESVPESTEPMTVANEVSPVIDNDEGTESDTYELPRTIREQCTTSVTDSREGQNLRRLQAIYELELELYLSEHAQVTSLGRASATGVCKFSVTNLD